MNAKLCYTRTLLGLELKVCGLGLSLESRGLRLGLGPKGLRLGTWGLDYITDHQYIWSMAATPRCGLSFAADCVVICQMTQLAKLAPHWHCHVWNWFTWTTTGEGHRGLVFEELGLRVGLMPVISPFICHYIDWYHVMMYQYMAMEGLV